MVSHLDYSALRSVIAIVNYITALWAELKPRQDFEGKAKLRWQNFRDKLSCC